MSYADGLLTGGEQIMLRSRQHWLALILRTRTGMVLFGLALLILVGIIFFNLQAGVVRDVLSAIGGIVLVLAVIVFAYRLIQWLATEYVITNRRLIKVSGILNKRAGDSSLEKINDAILTQPLLGRMLNYGDLEILTAADMANDLYRMLRDPKGFKKVMLTQKHALETEYSYVGSPPPTPPLRAPAPEYTAPPAPPAPPAPAPADPAVSQAAAVAATTATADPMAQPTPPAASPAPAPADSSSSAADPSLEVTQTLARLADLRDSGAITPEEYEQKKDELLSRL